MVMKNKALLLGGILAVVFLLVYLGVTLTANFGKSDLEVSAENAREQLDELYADISVKKETPTKGQIDLDPVDIGASLPDISKFPVTVENSTDSFVEIFASAEKAGKGMDGWLNEVATDFNKAGIQVGGKTVSVKIRNVASGTAKDYIVSGKYKPDAYTPSHELWGEMIKSSGLKAEFVTKRLIGNVPGIVLSKAKHDQLISKYGAVNVKTITEAVSKNELAMGYTDPFASSAGLNFLITTLYTFDSSNLLSDKAVQGFGTFQANVPFTASVTPQLREAAKSGALDGFVLEYSSYANTPDLKSNYVFTPYGVRHDSPLYAIGDLPQTKLEILKKFSEFVAQDKVQQAASARGFNGLNDYKAELGPIDGNLLSSAQKLWKDKKDVNKPVSAVFVTDVSGSMVGEPMNRLKESLLKAQKFLGKGNSIGLVSYSDNVTINLPIGKYDTNQQSLFVGAVNNLEPSGGTATFDGIIVALKMLQDELKYHPDVKPLIFVLSDGDTNKGHSLDDVKGLIETYKIPVYTVGYNADIKALQSISSINEAVSINADTDDVVYKLGNLFNVQM